MRQIYAASGEFGPLSHSGFYRGLNASILRDVFFAPMFFGQYQLWKRYFELDDLNHIDSLDRGQKYCKFFLAGGFSLFSAWLVIYPLDMVKTRIQGVDLKKSISGG